MMPIEYSGPEIESIELELQRARPNGWQRLDGATLEKFDSVMPQAGWELQVPTAQFKATRVDRLYVLTDRQFPRSEPRIVAPALELGEWPHVEKQGLLCLRATSWAASPGQRVVQALAYAEEVLNYTEHERAAEFAREFGSYWGQRTTLRDGLPTFIALMPPAGADAEIFFVRSQTPNWTVLANDEATLGRWLQNCGLGVAAKSVRRTRLKWLSDPWQPAHFPNRVSDVIRAVGVGELDRYMATDESLPVLFGASTATGNVFIGVDIPALPRKQFKNGFRPSSTVPGSMLARMSGGLNVDRCLVERADPAWVHGRGHNPQQGILASKRVALIGCGALGSALALLLVQMGVGGLMLVDGDKLTMANTSRHLLGAKFIGQNKARGMANRLKRDYPGIFSIEAFPVRFQGLSGADLEKLGEADLIVSAGIEWAGDAVLDRWRRSLRAPPPHLATWVEEFALAGHALVLFGADTIASGFSADGLPAVRLTDWPLNVQTQIVEAGCGNSFQPHGAIDLHDCVTLAGRLAVEVLVSTTTSSCHQAWLGDRAMVTKMGGITRRQFDASYVRKELPWPPSVD